MWSNERKSTAFNGMFKMTIRCRTTNMMLGTMSGDPDLFETYIASKAPTPKKMEEEILTAEEMAQLRDTETKRAITVFPTGKFLKTEDNVFYDVVNGDIVPDGVETEEVIVPFIWDYQWRGSFKESIAMLARGAKAAKDTSEDDVSEEKPETKTDDGETPKPKRKRRTKAEMEADASKKVQKCKSATIKSYKKVVDGGWFVDQRRIPLLVPDTYLDDFGNVIQTWKTDDAGNRHLPVHVRPIRVDTMQGPRVSISASEYVPAGTEFYFTVSLLNQDHKRALIETLDFKERVGMLQWRGGGKGTLIWTPADSNGKPIDVDPLSL